MTKVKQKNLPVVNDLSPDGFSRFYFIVDVLERTFRSKSVKISILDVGGGSEFIEQQLKSRGINYDLTVMDIIDRPQKLSKQVEYIKADATKMTLEDDSFDVVISTDVLEHVKPDRKEAFVSECTRVAKQMFILAAPFNTPGVDSAEVVVNEFNKKLFGVGQDWLEEHLLFGKPEISMVKKVLDRNNTPYYEFGTHNLTTWLLNTHINLIDAKLGLNVERHKEINNFYNENILFMGESEGATYRHFFVSYKNTKLQKYFNPSIYKNSKKDESKSAYYTSELFILLSNRIEKLSNENYKLEKKVTNLSEINLKLEIKTTDQEQLISKLQPIIKLARSKPVRVARKFVRNGKQ